MDHVAAEELQCWEQGPHFQCYNLETRRTFNATDSAYLCVIKTSIILQSQEAGYHHVDGKPATFAHFQTLTVGQGRAD